MMEYVPYEHRQEDAATFNLYINFEAEAGAGQQAADQPGARAEPRGHHQDAAVGEGAGPGPGHPPPRRGGAATGGHPQGLEEPQTSDEILRAFCSHVNIK